MFKPLWNNCFVQLRNYANGTLTLETTTVGASIQIPPRPLILSGAAESGAVAR